MTTPTYFEVTEWLRENHKAQVNVYQQGAAWTCSCGARTGHGNPKGGVTNKTEARARAALDRHLQAARDAYRRSFAG